VTEETPRTVRTASKDVLRKLIPNFLLQQRGIVRRLGPRAGRIYAGLRLRDVLGVRTANQRIVPQSARSFLFVCFGKLERSSKSGSYPPVCTPPPAEKRIPGPRRRPQVLEFRHNKACDSSSFLRLSGIHTYNRAGNVELIDGRSSMPRKRVQLSSG
jgi:hypothetical protein